jgi:ABC-type branched-subunit amino acid transport system substrate-binding protein
MYDRRRISVATAVAIVSLVGLAPPIGAQTPGQTRLRIGLVIPPGLDATAASASVVRGVRLGAAESKQTAQLFGDDVQLFEATGTDAMAAAAARQLLSQRKVQILIGASAGDAEALSRFSESAGILFFNAASRSQTLRSDCVRHAFHIEGTDAMYANVKRNERASNGVTRSVPRAGNADSVVLWAPTLQRFGASQINDRYSARYGAPMDGSAWAGWAAVKIAAEAVLRARSTVPDKVLAYLESPSTQFDGHKGWPLTFRATDHQLRQPLYIVVNRTGNAGSQSARDVPELRGPGSSPSSSIVGERGTDRELDALIASPDARRCPWTAR